MKKTIRFLTIIGGLFRSIITILFLFASIFTAFVDKNLLAGFLDIVGFSKISLGFVKPLAIIFLLLGFILNFKVSRNIFLSGKTGKKNLSNIFFSVFFIVADLLILLFIREKLVYIPIALNTLVILTSIMGLSAKAKGLYGQSFKPKKSRGRARRRESIERAKAGEVENTSATNKVGKIDPGKVISLNFVEEERKKDISDEEKASNPIKKEDKLSVEPVIIEKDQKQDLKGDDDNLDDEVSKAQIEKEQENKLDQKVKEQIDALKANTDSLINKLEEAQNNLQKNEEKE